MNGNPFHPDEQTAALRNYVDDQLADLMRRPLFCEFAWGDVSADDWMTANPSMGVVRVKRGIQPE